MILLTGLASSGHAVRHALLEKGVKFEFYSAELNNLPTAYRHFNFETYPCYLIDQQLVIFQTRLILEYLDERYPAPALMPIDPVARAQVRLLMHHMGIVVQHRLERLADAKSVDSRKELFEDLRGAERTLKNHDYLLGNTLSLVDLIMFECLAKIHAVYPGFLALLPNLTRYYSQLRQRPASKRFEAMFNPAISNLTITCAPSS